MDGLHPLSAARRTNPVNPVRAGIAAILLMLAPAVCAQTAASVKAKSDSAVVERLDGSELCLELGQQSRLPSGKRDAAFLQEISRRVRSAGWMESGDELLIERRDVRIGMHLCGVLAALGTPDQDTAIDTDAGSARYLVYRNGQVRVFMHADRVSQIGQR